MALQIIQRRLSASTSTIDAKNRENTHEHVDDHGVRAAEVARASNNN